MSSMVWAMRVAVPVLMLMSAACQCGSPCDPSCSGCCDPTFGCMPGDNFYACGRDGVTCDICQARETCQQRRCVPLPPGPGGPVGGPGIVFDGGVDAGFQRVFGPIDDPIGKPCNDDTGLECLVPGVELQCLDAVTVSGMRKVCQDNCLVLGRCRNDAGTCNPRSMGGRSCADCVVPCVLPPDGGLQQGTCLPNELCVRRGSGAVCTPDCRLQRAVCVGGATCLEHNGLCANGAEVSYCLSW